MKIALSSRNESERSDKKAIQLFHHFKQKNILRNRSSNSDFFELKLNLPIMKAESPKRTPKYHSFFRHNKLSKSISSTLNLSSSCNQNISYTAAPLLKENNCNANETEFLQYRNASLMRNYKNDELLKKIRCDCENLFNASTVEVLNNYFNQLQQSRQAETYYLFTKFNSSSSTFNIHSWKEIVSMNYDLAYYPLKIIEALLIECSKGKKSPQLQQTQKSYKLPQMTLIRSSTPSSSMIDMKTFKPIENEREHAIRDLKQKLVLQEGQHKLSLYHLEEEIKALTFLLEKQKDYTKTNIEIESRLAIKINEINQMKRDSKKKTEELENQIIDNRDKNILFTESLMNMRDENEALKEEITEYKQRVKDQNVIINKLANQTKEHQGSIQVLLKEKEELYDDIKSIKEKHTDALFNIRDLEKRRADEKKGKN